MLVSSGDTPGTSPRRLRLWNFLTKEVVRQRAFDSTVSACAVNKTHIAVGTEDSVILFDLASFSQKYSIAASRACKVLFALSTCLSDGAPLLAYCAPCDERKLTPEGDGTLPGEVAILDCHQLRVVSRLRAHRTALSCLALSPSRALLATASVTGSIVRVFVVPDGTCIQELRHSLPGSLHLFSFLSPTGSAGSSSRSGGTAAGSVPGGAASITALSFCPRSRYLLSVSANAAGHRGGFLNVFRLRHTEAAADGFVRHAPGTGAVGNGTENGDDDDDYLKVEADDAPSAAEPAPADTSLAGSLQGWQALLTNSAAAHLSSLRALSQEYVVAATTSTASARLTSGDAPALYVRIHSAQDAIVTGDYRLAGAQGSNGKVAAPRQADEESPAAQQRSGSLGSAPQSSGQVNFHALLSYSARGGGLALTVISAESGVLRRYGLGFLEGAAPPAETVSLSDARAASTSSSTATTVAAEVQQQGGAGAGTGGAGPALPRTLGEVLEEERLLLDF